VEITIRIEATTTLRPGIPARGTAVASGQSKKIVFTPVRRLRDAQVKGKYISRWEICVGTNKGVARIC